VSDFPEIGASVDSYRVIRELGRGPLGITYLAESLDRGTVVALKFMVPPAPLDPDTAVTLTAELRKLSRLGSPDIIVPTYHNDLEGRYALVAPYVDEGSLQHRLDRTGPLPREAALGVGVHVARALHEAHGAGVFHGAVKPTNVFPVAHGEVLTAALTDFGTVLRSHPWQGAEGFDAEYAAGFVAPELIGSRPIAAADARSDVYSLGCLLFALLSGRSPYDGPPPTVPTAIPQLPVRDATDEAINALVTRALQPDPAYRWESIAEVGRRLGELARANGTPSPVVPAAGSVTAAITVAEPATADSEEGTDSRDDRERTESTESTEDTALPAPAPERSGRARGRLPGRPAMLALAVVAAVAAIVVVALLHHRHETPQASGSPASTPRMLHAPSVTARPAYRAVTFTIEEPRRAEGATVQVDRGSGWEATNTDKVSVPTDMGGRRTCLRARLVDGDSASRAVRTCGTSRPPVMRMVPIGGCTIGTATYTSCYQLRLRGFEPGTLEVNSSAPDASGQIQSYTDEVDIDEDGTGVDPARFGASVSQSISISAAGVEREFTIG